MTPGRDERGALLPIVALLLTTIIVCTALAIDVGRARVLRRDLQRVADIAALDASRVLTDAPAVNQLAAVRAAAVRSATRNGYALDANDVHLVRRNGTAWTTADAALVAPDGVEVVAQGDSANTFARGFIHTSRAAVAGRPRTAGVQIGSSLVNLDTQGATLWSSVFDVLVGTSPDISLTAVAWNGLLASDVTFGALAAAANVATVDDYLDASTTLGAHLAAVSAALSASGNATAAATVAQLRTQLSATASSVPIRIGDLVQAEGVSPEQLASTSVNVFELVRGSVLLARRGSGAISGTLDSGIPGIVSPSITVNVIEPPVIAFGPIGVRASTGQIDVTVSLSLLGLAPIRVSVGAAEGTATLASIACGSGVAANSAGATVSTTVASLSLEVLTLGVPWSVPGVTATALTFTAPFTWAHRQHVASSGLNLTGAVSGALPPVTRFLVGGLLGPLETQLVTPVFRALGLTLAGADVAVLTPQCSSLRLLD